MRHIVAAAATVILGFLTRVAGANSDLVLGDAHYQLRTDQEARRVNASELNQSIARYKAAIEADPENLEPRWKLIRALRFKLIFGVGEDRDEKETWQETATLAVESIEVLDILLERAANVPFPRTAESRLSGDTLLFPTEVDQVGVAIGKVKGAPELLYQVSAFDLNLRGVSRTNRDKYWIAKYRMETAYVAAICLMSSASDVSDGSSEVLFALHQLFGGRKVQMRGEPQAVPSRAQIIRYLRGAIAHRQDDRWSRVFLAQALIDDRRSAKSFLKSREVIASLHETAAMPLRPDQFLEDQNVRDAALEVLHNDRVSWLTLFRGFF